MKIRLFVLTVLIAAPCFGGDDWLCGSWKFDRDSTIAGLRTNAPAGRAPASPGMPDWVSPHPLLIISQLDGAQYSFSATNVTITTKAGTQVKPYTVVKRPSSSQMIIQIEGSATNCVRHASNHIEFDGNVGFTLFFSHVSK